MHRRWGLVVVGIVLLAACSSSDDEPTIAPSPSTTSTTAADAAPSPLQLGAERRDDGAVCLVVTVRNKPTAGSSTNCEAALLEGQAVSVGGGGLSGYTFANGQVIATASAVRVELDGGRSVEAEILSADGVSGLVWLATLPDGAVPRAVTVVDEGGREIVRQPFGS